ncbi:4'-phosphopantetheinyl transferase family protein [Corynebacterium uterequi]|uniref:Phosphopantetheinyl transferase component of siderophore synthetase n=1 Tax=Corynebacterium uterequi TaxID=1072256 RepID=A0A0G3HF17_9CORY|nr:4'-phosphopantetheinyl transferase superfamily protein [Corynebacterium uterequi]AKK11325.1 phosphopantetheinyl transferase component of siderophore synthetase [Corynebacterium uterequi]
MSLLAQGLFPPGVVLKEATGTPVADPERLPPSERAVIAQAVPTRRAEFAHTRELARQALAELGYSPVAIPRGERGAPCWPAGIVGSLTHTEGYRAAAVSQTLTSVGIDAEPSGPLPDGVLDAIALPGERRRLAGYEELGLTGMDRVLFCAKEATYKTWFPVTRRWLGFEEADIELFPDGRMRSRILAPQPEVAVIEGRWRVVGGFALVVGWL